jgi:hypothetical protein
LPFNDPGDLASGLALVLVSFLLLPVATTLALVGTIRLIRGRRSALRGFSATDKAFLAFGVLVSVAGIGLCVRVAMGILLEG